MTKVSFFSTQVKYSGDFEDYKKEDLFKMAIAKQDKGVDCFDKSENFPDTQAKWFDGRIWVDNTYPCNKIATVKWSYFDSQECVRY